MSRTLHASRLLCTLLAAISASVVCRSAAEPTPGNFLYSHRHPILRLDWSNDGRVLISQDEAGVIKQWRAGSRVVTTILDRKLPQWPLKGLSYTAAVSRDARRLASLESDGYIHIREVGRTTDTLMLAPLAAEVESLAWSPDGNRLAVASSQSVMVFSTVTSRMEWSKQLGDKVAYVVWGPHGKRVLTSEYAATLTLVRASDGKELRHFRARIPLSHDFQTNYVASWSPNGKLVASLGTELDRVEVWSADTGKPVSVIRPGDALIFWWSNDSRRIAIPTREPAPAISIWDVRTAQRQAILPAHTDVSTIAWRPSAPELAVGFVNGEVRLLNVQSKLREN